MQSLKTPNAEPIPGYRLVEPLGSGGFGEVWKCEAPGGLVKAVKFVSGGNHLADSAGEGIRQELRALRHIKTIRHPFLISIDRAEVVDGDLIIVMELADKSLHDLLTTRRAAGKDGIERGEVLRYLAEVAEVLDVLNQEYGLQHLDVKPRNLFLVGRHVKLADFGLVNSLSELHTGEANPVALGAVTPLYAAPESFLGRITLYSDQYSLAITYHELLTGSLPFVAKNSRQMALLHLQGEPDLARLPEADRPIVAQAMAKEPRERFLSCTAFVEALRAQQEVNLPSSRPRSDSTRFDLNLGRLASTATVPNLRECSPTDPAPAAAPAPAVTSGDSFVSGYHFLECVGRMPMAEVWKAQTRDGRKRLVKLFRGLDPDEASPGGNPLDRLRSIRHETLASLEIVRADANRLALITDPGDLSLAGRLKECQRDGLPGIPRIELLDYLRLTAEALDALYQTHRLQHLGLTPSQLVLDAGKPRLLDFALAELLWIPLGQQPAALNTRYAALELFDGQISRRADQYSLALIYQELLTGAHAYRNLNQRQMALARLRDKPDLGLLPATDRPAVLRALHPNPEQRFPTCTDFVEALAGASFEYERPASRSTCIQPVSARPRPAAALRLQLPAGSDPVPPALERLVERLAAAAHQDHEVHTVGEARFLLYKAQAGPAGPFIEHRCFARLVAGTAHLKLDGFRQQHKAEATTAPDGTFVFHVRTKGSLWQRCVGRTPGLEVRVRIEAPRPGSALTPVSVRIEPINCNPQVLQELGPVLLTSIRNYLQAHPDRRRLERFAFEESIQVAPLLAGLDMGEAVVAQSFDLSRGGMGLCLPCRPTSSALCLNIPGTSGPIPVVGRIAYTRPLEDGRHLLGVCFVRPEEV